MRDPAEMFGPIDHNRLTQLEKEATAHSMKVHGTDGPDIECETCLQLAKDAVVAAGLTVEILRMAVDNGVPVPPNLKPLIHALVGKEVEYVEDPWT